MAKLRSKKKSKPSNKTDKATYTPSHLSNIYGSIIDAVDKELSLDSGLEISPRLSTGILTLDLMHGGGLGFGMSIFVGKEQSGKTTSGLTTLGQAISANIPVSRVYDAENALHPEYAQNILSMTTKLRDLSTLVGSRSEKTGKWIVRPAYYYTDTNITEDVFKSIHKLLAAMPNKRYRRGQWYLVFENTKKQTALMKEIGFPEDKSISSGTGKHWCPVDTEDAQAFFLVDSLNSLVPEEVDDEDVTGNALALEARYLGRYLRLVRGKMRQKGAILLAVNQLRDNPGQRMGNPEYETGGNAPKQFSDIRVKFASRVPPDGFARDKEASGLCIEPSIWIPGGHDRYAFKAFQNIKNKLGTPYRKSGGRVWVSDGQGTAHGFDPVYDAYRFLTQIGGIKKHGKRGSKEFTVEVNDQLFKSINGFVFNWKTFKTLVLAETMGLREIKDIADKENLPRIALRKRSLELMKVGRAEALHQVAMRSGDSDEEE